MVDGKSDQTRRIVVALVAMTGVLRMPSVESAHASTLRPIHEVQSQWQISCPPGRRVELQFGQVSLFIDPRWATVIGTYAKGALPDDCPTTPQSPDLAILAVDRATSKDGLPKLLHFRRFIPSFRAFYEEYAALPSTRRVAADGVAIDEVTTNPLIADEQVRHQRRYRLHHPATFGDPTLPPWRVRCIDDRKVVRERHCTVEGVFGLDLAVGYASPKVRQLDPTTRTMAADELLMEPSGLLEIDVRVRTFIEELRQKP